MNALLLLLVKAKEKNAAVCVLRSFIVKKNQLMVPIQGANVATVATGHNNMENVRIYQMSITLSGS